MAFMTSPLALLGELRNPKGSQNVILKCGSRSLRVHNSVLAVHSSLLKSLFLERNVEEEIILLFEDDSVNFDALETLIEYMYVGSVDCGSLERYEDVQNLANLLGIGLSLVEKLPFDEFLTSTQFIPTQSVISYTQDTDEDEEYADSTPLIKRIRQTSTSKMEIDPFRENVRCRFPQCHKVKPFSNRRRYELHMKQHFTGGTLACEFCGKKYSKIHHYLEHVDKGHKDGGFVCLHPDCESSSGRFFTTEVRFKLHQRIHQRGSLQCSECLRYFKSVRYFIEHYQKNHEISDEQLIMEFLDGARFVPKTEDDGSTYSCPEEGCKENVFKSKVEFEFHTSRHENGELVPCRLCSKSFAELKEFASHRQLEHPEGTYYCNKCNKGNFDSKELIHQHLTSHEYGDQINSQINFSQDLNDDFTMDDKEFECTQKGCADSQSRFFSSSKNLDSHLRTHIPNLICTICSKVFKSLKCFKRHERLHKRYSSTEDDITEAKSLKKCLCLTCGRIFSGMNSLRKHRIQHQSHRQIWKCEHCEKTFVTKEGYRIHLRIHIGGMFYCVTCNRRFSTSSQLRKHQTLHTGVRSFICEYCGASFLDSRHLRNHKIRSHTDPAVKCNHCDKKFHFRSNLREHVNSVHLKIRKFECSVCLKTFLSSSNLKTHLATHKS